MTLPFDENAKKKKFQCFVCGVEFLEFEEFKNHIIKEHEEGREYVLCPIQYCKAPVRDLRLHFKVFHPKDKLPPVSQTKAIVWKNFTPSRNKKKPAKKASKYREGDYMSTKMNRYFHYRSGYECTMYECLDSLNEVLCYEAEPFKIPYMHKGEMHNYTPDLFVQFVDGRKEVWEIKPASQTTLQRNKDKWHAMAKVCVARGWAFKIKTEKGIQEMKKKVRDQNQRKD